MCNKNRVMFTSGLLMLAMLTALAGCSKEESAPSRPAGTEGANAPTGPAGTVEEKSAGGNEETSADTVDMPAVDDETPADKAEAPAGDENGPVGKWEMHAGGDDFDDDAFPPEIEFCDDGTMNDPSGLFAEMGFAWTAKDGKLVLSANYKIGPERDVDVATVITFDYALSGSTLTLSNGWRAATIDGEAADTESILGSMTYGKVDDWTKPQAKPQINRNPEIHLQCVNLKCQAELVKKYLDFSEEDRQKLFAPRFPLPPDMDPPPQLKCEKCGSNMGRQIQCPYEDCKKWSLDPMELDYTNMKRICPHCERDSNMYWQQKAAEAQKR